MGLFKQLFSVSPSRRAEPRRAAHVEQLEQRQLLAADVILGGVYFEEATGDDSEPDILQVSFEGGAEGTVLNRIIIDGDKASDGGLTIGDVFFDTAAGGRGDFDSVPLSIVSSDGFDVTGVSVQDGGTRIVFDLSGFEAGELLVFSVDVDEFQAINPITGLPRDNALVEGSEFEFSSLVGEFSAEGFVDLELSGTFFDFFDSNRVAAETAAGSELTQLPDDIYEPGDDFSDRTAGAVAHEAQLELATLSGYVYHDQSDDGVFDANEDPIGEVTVELLDNNGQVVATTTTNGDGFYEFINLDAGVYGVRETQPNGFFDGKDTAGTVGGATVGVASNDLITQIVLGYGDDGINYNFGELLGGSIAGRVHADTDGDCDFDDPDVLLEGVVIELLDAAGKLITSTTTDKDGRYKFDNLAPGEYQVRETQPTDLNGRPLFDGDQRVGDAGGNGSVNDLITGIVIGSEQDAVNYDFCEHLGASISGYVYHDESNDGVFDPSEAPIPGTTLKLLDADGNETGRTAITDANGFYQFTDLAPGKYTVMEFQPEDFLDGKDTPGSTGGDASVNDMIAEIMIDFGSDSMDNNFGELLPGSIAGRVHASMDGDCDFDAPDVLLSGVTIELLNAHGEIIETTQTNAAGEYLFDNLPPGTYSVREIQPDGYFDGVERIGSEGGAFLGTDTIAGIQLGSDVDAANYDFCEHVGASLSGHVYHDESDDGLFDPTEDPIAGVELTLLDATGAVVATAVTDANGFYKFNNLDAGKYTVVEAQPAGFYDGKDTAGTTGGDTSVNDQIREIMLDYGGDSEQNNFGELLGASLGGRVHAENGPDCDFDDPDVLLEGVTIQLLDADGNVVEETQTDANGEYRFNNLRPGEYQIREIQPTEHEGRALFDGGENIGDNGGEVLTNDVISSIVLGSGEDVLGYHFCEHFGATISGFVYHDQSDDGVFDPSEDPIAGVELKLLLGDGTDTGRRAVTDARGFYEFSDLGPGKYTVMENQPAGYLDGKDTPGAFGDGIANQDDMIAMIMVDFGDESTDNNFGELLPGSIAGRVHADTDGDCDYDDPDILLEGVTIELLNADGDVIRTTQTNAAGDYLFDNLPPGMYTVREVQPADYFNGEYRIGSGSGSNFGIDTIGDILVGSDQHLINYDFCEVPPAQLSGFVFVDGAPIVTFGSEAITPEQIAATKDGVRTPDDRPIEGVVLELRHGETGELIVGEDLLPGVYPDGPVTTVTGSDGFYQFIGLPAGVYAVVEAQPIGFIDGIDTFGSLGGVAINPTPDGSPQVFQTSTQPVVDQFAAAFGNDVILLINLGVGQNSVENNFSEVTTTTIPIPPEPPEPPTPVPPVAPPPQVFTPAALPPVTSPPPIEYPIYAGSSQALGWTWHLSVINAGQPRAIEMSEADAQFASAKLNDEAWRNADMDRAEWKLIDDDQRADELREFVFGNENAIPVSGDWNGDGVTDIGVFVDGYWFLDLNGNGRWDAGDLWAQLGSETDLPVTGDWDADGKDDIGIFGPAWPRDPHAIARDPGLPDAENFPTRLAHENGHLKAKNVPPTEEDATSGGRVLRRTIRDDGRTDRIDHVFHYGTPGDVPIAGDWNGDGVRTIGVYRDGVWTLDTDGDGRLTDRDESFATGGAGLPAVGDWNGDGIDDIGVFNAGEWLVDSNGDRELDARDTAFELGDVGDRPIVGDWDGDGVDEPGAYGPKADEAVRVSQKAG